MSTFVYAASEVRTVFQPIRTPDAGNVFNYPLYRWNTAIALEYCMQYWVQYWRKYWL
jgi:hypothetical protein